MALLARRSESLDSVISKVRETSPDVLLEAFPSDTSKVSLEKAFKDIKSHPTFKHLKLKLAIYSIKHSSKKPFLDETREEFEESLQTYVGGAFTFAQESLKRFFADHGERDLADGGEKKGVSEASCFMGNMTKILIDTDFYRHTGSSSLQCAVRRVWCWPLFRSATSTNISSRDE